MDIKIPMKFDGFWIEDAIEKVPEATGIYTVFGGFYEESDKSVKLEQVIYIGWAENAREDIKTSRHKEEWAKECEDECWQLVFSFASVEAPNNERGAAALIFEQKPPVNEQYKYEFPFDDTKVKLSGKTGLLDTSFEVYKFEGEDIEPDEPENVEGFGELDEDPTEPSWGHLPPPLPEKPDDDSDGKTPPTK
ncbi:MAG: hypothetical protein V3T30_00035 [Thermodesulfobacteriota bacterium]